VVIGDAGDILLKVLNRLILTFSISNPLLAIVNNETFKGEQEVIIPHSAEWEEGKEKYKQKK